MPDSRPNVVIVTLHDTGRHFGCYGLPQVKSPNIDRLASEGCRFTRAFTTTPVCSASRAAMMTGRYPQSNGLLSLIHEPWNSKLNDDEVHLAERLRDAGYRSVLVGFQHEDHDPARLGFAEALDTAPDEPKNATRRARLAAEWLCEHATADQPFYLQMGFWETHTPYDRGGVEPHAPDGVYLPDWVVDNDAAHAHFAGLQGAVWEADQAVGILLETLEQQGLADNTLVIFTVDHGVEVGRAAKWTCFEPGLEIGLIIRHPAGGISGGKVYDGLTSNVDLAPFVLRSAGLDIPAEMQGIDPTGFHKDGATSHRDYVFSQFSANERVYRAVRGERYKLVASLHPCRRPAVPVDLNAPRQAMGMSEDMLALFDLEADPTETNNLASDPAHAQHVAKLKAKLTQWMREVDDPILRGPIATPYYLASIDQLVNDSV